MNKWTVRRVLGNLLPLTLACAYTVTVAANDLDDGIAIDEPLNDELKLGVNVPFILMKAKAKELTGQKSKVVNGKQDGAIVGQGNIVIGPGVRLPAGTVIINNSDNEGATAVAR